MGNYGLDQWGQVLPADYIFPSTELIFGSNKHNHTVEDEGDVHESEIQPAALEEDIADFITPIVEPRSTPLATTAVAATQDPPYEGRRNKILPEEHSHIVRVSDEDLEPPRIKLKVCEKI